MRGATVGARPQSAAGQEDREAGEEDAALAAEIAEPAEREHEARGDELVDREGEADRDVSARSSCWTIGRTVTIALALAVERNPLAPRR